MDYVNIYPVVCLASVCRTIGHRSHTGIYRGHQGSHKCIRIVTIVTDASQWWSTIDRCWLGLSGLLIGLGASGCDSRSTCHVFTITLLVWSTAHLYYIDTPVQNALDHICLVNNIYLSNRFVAAYLFVNHKRYHKRLLCPLSQQLANNVPNI